MILWLVRIVTQCAQTLVRHHAPQDALAAVKVHAKAHARGHAAEAAEVYALITAVDIAAGVMIRAKAPAAADAIRVVAVALNPV